MNQNESARGRGTGKTDGLLLAALAGGQSQEEATNMTKAFSTLIILPLAAAFAMTGTPSRADSPTTTTSQSYSEQITTTPITTSSVAPEDMQAMSIHDQAVELAHRATWAAQHGEKKLAVQLAAQAQDLFNQAYRSTTFYAHRRVLLYNASGSNLEFGSRYPDAPKTFFTDRDFLALWAGPRRVLLVVPEDKNAEVLEKLPRGSVRTLAKSGGKTVYVNRSD